jgi:hypothetical protein
MPILCKMFFGVVAYEGCEETATVLREFNLTAITC